MLSKKIYQEDQAVFGEVRLLLDMILLHQDVISCIIEAMKHAMIDKLYNEHSQPKGHYEWFCILVSERAEEKITS